MSKPILLDTDVMVDFLRGQEQAVAFVHTHADRIILSALAVAEVYAGVKGDKEQEVLDDFVSLFPVKPITPELARIGGLFKRDYGKSHGVGLGDALVAATAQKENAELATLNVRHYPMLKGIVPPYAKA